MFFFCCCCFFFGSSFNQENPTRYKPVCVDAGNTHTKKKWFINGNIFLSCHYFRCTWKQKEPHLFSVRHQKDARQWWHLFLYFYRKLLLTCLFEMYLAIFFIWYHFFFNIMAFTLASVVIFGKKTNKRSGIQNCKKKPKNIFKKKSERGRLLVCFFVFRFSSFIFFWFVR